jgi:hypothetical protein
MFIPGRDPECEAVMKMSMQLSAGVIVGVLCLAPDAQAQSANSAGYEELQRAYQQAMQNGLPVIGQQTQRIAYEQAARNGLPGQLQTQRVMPRGYSVVLVLGDSAAGNGVADNVPEAAKKALADMKDFLPYKSYRLLDAAWILGTSATSQLRGMDDMVYSVRINANSLSWAGTLWNVNFSLDEAGAGRSSQSLRQDIDLVNKLNALKLERVTAQQKYKASNPRVTELDAKIAEINTQMSADRSGRNQAILDTSFSMNIGETVVVGTSRVRGDKALIVLLTSVAEKK